MSSGPGTNRSGPPDGLGGGEMSLAEAFAVACRQHARGYLAPAEGLYRRIAEAIVASGGEGQLKAELLEVYSRLGQLLHQQGRTDEAIETLRTAVAALPDNCDAYSNLGFLLMEAGRLEEAISACARAVELNGEAAGAYCNWGGALRAQGKLDEAVDKLKRAIEIDPNLQEAHNTLGIALTQTGKYEQAVESLQRAVQLNPNDVRALCNLGEALRKQGRPVEAIEVLNRAGNLAPNHVGPYLNLAKVLEDQDQVEQAAEYLRRAVALAPNSAEARRRLAWVLHKQEKMDEAVAEFQQLLRIEPDSKDGQVALGGLLRRQGRFDEALAAVEAVLRTVPDHGGARFIRALTYLHLGRFQEGWREYEWRWKWQDTCLPKPDYDCPLWDGSALDGRRILLQFEQGFGDVIQFIRYAPLVARRGGHVLVMCRKEMVRLLRTVEGVREVVPYRGEPPAFDLHCPLMTLPLIFGTTLQTVPSTVPYLHPAPASVEGWRRRLAAPPRLRVGLVWAVRHNAANYRRRSMPVRAFEPVLADEDVAFYSLQVGRDAGDLDQLPDGRVTDLSGDLCDFAETAAAVSALDLVITVDTAVAHLAGALAKDVWVLLPHVADWRWMVDRDDSPWYPTMRLFRQTAEGDWGGVIERVALALRRR